MLAIVSLTDLKGEARRWAERCHFSDAQSQSPFKRPKQSRRIFIDPRACLVGISLTSFSVISCFGTIELPDLKCRTHNVSDVHLAAQLLGGAFDIVTPDEFVARLKRYVKKDCNRTKVASGTFLDSCKGGVDSCGVLTNWMCASRTSSLILNEFFDHTSCASDLVSNCFGRLLCQDHNCTCTANATGSYLSSCTDCENSCGALFGCQCTGMVATQKNFDYSSCPGLAVANCFGALICQGEPCE